jgi:hypothetical protein
MVPDRAHGDLSSFEIETRKAGKARAGLHMELPIQ